MMEELKQRVLEANQALVKHGLVILTWGNASGFDREQALMVIKPSGLAASDLYASDMVVVDIRGKVVEGRLKPSADTSTHLELYKAFDGIAGITHTHSIYATMFAQAILPIPCLGTTHADTFFGDVPVTRLLEKREVEREYEKNTGKIIVELFAGKDPLTTPAALAAGHGPFTWGRSPGEALQNAVALEAVAELAWGTRLLKQDVNRLPDYLMEKHYERKHGPGATYGQNKK
jgi:L-ribulose-5-phosphate 4-epimerase